MSLAPASKIYKGDKVCASASAFTLKGLREHHGAAAVAGAVAFYRSATVVTEAGRQLEFVAGDISHGAKMIYDVEPVRKSLLHACVVVKSIYSLAAAPDDVWMGALFVVALQSSLKNEFLLISHISLSSWFSAEHHYLFTHDDIEERPAWAAALAADPVVADDGELLLSVGVYNSPMHLIVGDFGVCMPPEAQDKKWRTGAAPPFFPAFPCRRGFDAAAGGAVSLCTALTMFSA